MGNLNRKLDLKKGRAIGAQVGFADAFAEISRILDQLQVDPPLTLTKMATGTWTISLDEETGAADVLLDDVSIHKRVLTGEDPQPVQLLDFDSPSSRTLPEPEEPADGDTALDGMDDFQLLVRRVDPITSAATLGYIGKSGLAKILGARTERVLTIEQTDSQNYTLRARDVLVFSAEFPDPSIVLSLTNKRIISGVEWDSPDLKEKAISALVIGAADASGSDTATGTDSTIATFIPHSSL